MKKRMTLLLLLAVFMLPVSGADVKEVKPVKNIILLIPDGTSLATVSIARWLQWYDNPDLPKLNIDPYLCGTVRTHSSNAPIGDSAPTTSCYMTGYPSRTGYVSTYPESDPQNDIYPNDPARAFQPLATVLEAGQWLHGKAGGLVFTCEFPHATPADCSAHSYNRGKYEWIAPQMAHNDLAVVIGGGISFLPEESENYLKANGYSVYKNDLNAMRNDSSDKMWALFGDGAMDYDIDRDPAQQPSIEEMTRKAIEKLSMHEDGFFLMVEGSKVDWAAHGNDPVGMATDFLAFDRACGAALEFARKNGETAVIIVPDHGNSGVSLGARHCGGYDKLSKDQLFSAFSQFKLTAEGFVKKLNSEPASEVQNIFREYAGFELNESELQALYHCKSYKNSPIPENERSSEGIEPSLYSGSLNTFISNLITSKTCFAFTTGGHTGEEVFLAAYHPNGDLPIGMHTNIELNEYLCKLFGFNRDLLDELSNQNFAQHTEVFKGYTCEIVPAKEEKGFPTLVVKNKKKQLNIKPFTNIVTEGKKGDKEIRLNSVIVYVDKNNIFYLPESLAEYLK
ncbi:alkaline phosphatase [Parabacteroides sp. PF5-5]|uniref:alkaline phosphatase n=1 Tax=unclassified Parabacteroides TaxID=2649774 RepID=UPI0024744441|nr:MULTISPECIES: alkaline phosphatase [unclassified Parabacteroides]MDH6305096.1 alkaline phosphatase [Parabacteroides sp. PH5-39]MDH6316446.1 alkaline phosphatase [Parabacteroides sp. PF5-13]MDH6319956.1 alkaline phosphatase [Parabacteroides sp. PH5-13]MDH6323811.1 alkaline phosphatase [Parabacteroides sp. PH5-8]MDH6327633.1 alkaline phosphatase [Parabacteroides sp. PH5-41]